MKYIVNSFSLNMLSTFKVNISLTELSLEQARLEYDCSRNQSAIGHADTAKIVSALLQKEVPCNRATLSLKAGDSLLVAQYRGPRLPEGCTVLPEGSTIEWALVEIT